MAWQQLALQPRTWSIKCPVCDGTGKYYVPTGVHDISWLPCQDCKSTGILKSMPRGDCMLQWWVKNRDHNVKCRLTVPQRTADRYAADIANYIGRRVLVLVDNTAVFFAIPQSYYTRADK